MLTLDFIIDYYRTNGCSCETPPVAPGAEHEAGCAVVYGKSWSPSGTG